MSVSEKDSAEKGSLDTKEGYLANVVPVEEKVVDNRGLSTGGTARGLTPRHIQLIGIGSTIGTGLYIGSGRSLLHAGPLGALIAYMLYSVILWGVCQGTGEMGTFMPVTGGYVYWATRWVDPAAGTAIGWNYFYAASMFAAADVVAIVGLFGYWWPDVSPAAWVGLALGIFILLNVFHVKFFGESEFYFASLKVILLLGLVLMTFVIMLGGNPDHDRVGFRYWKNPGPMAEYVETGNLGRFLGFWAVFKVAAYSLGGPEFVSICAAEAIRPYRSIPKATRAVLFRLAFFFFFGILAIGILVPYNDPLLIDAVANGVGANASPYVVGMKRVGIKILPDIFNAVVITSALSCSNGLIFVATRVMHSLAVSGQAPAIFKYTTKRGVPIYAFALTLAIQCLGFMTINNKASTVFTWLINLSSVAQLLNYVAICITTLRFRAGLKAQGIDIKDLPWQGWHTIPYIWFSLSFLILIVITQGWNVFVNGAWDTQDFLTDYFGIAFVTVVYFGWKFWHKTKIVGVHEMDFVTHVAELDAYEQKCAEEQPVPVNAWGRLMDYLF